MMFFHLVVYVLFHTLCFFQQTDFRVKSPDFAQNHYIQSKFTCDGQNRSPGLVFENIPKEARSLVLVMEDRDVASGEFVHWLMWNIPVKSVLPENKATGVQGKNSRNQCAYTGPCPPNGEHTYFITVYALDIRLTLDSSANKADVLNAMAQHVLSQAELSARYYRK